MMAKLNFIIMCYLLCFNAFAVEQDMEDFFSMSPLELGNLSVSIATGTAKPIYQSAAVTSVITAEQIKAMGATELSQVLETVPGLHVSIQDITNDPVYSMRGMRNDLNNEVLVMLNGTRFSVPYKGSSMTGLTMPVEAIQRIEVIRGPGSALYGADAFAGVINVITKKAKDIEGTVVGVRGGSWDTQSVWGLHGDHWMGWDIAATLQYAHNNNDGDRIIKSDLQSQFDAGFGTNASLTPGEIQNQSERWNAHLNVQRQYWDIDFWAFNEVDQGLNSGAAGSLDDEGTLNGENYLADLHFSSEDLMQDWEILAHVNYLFTEIEVDTHLFPDGAVLPIDSDGNVSPTPVGVTFFPDGVLAELGIENQVVAVEFGTIFKGLEHHLLRFTSGFRYEQLRTKERRNSGEGVLNGMQALADGTLTRITGSENIFIPDSQRTIWSVAIQDEWQISQDWLFTAGIRYDEYSDFGSTVNPRFALVWDVNEQLSTKLLYGHAYRAPSFLEQKQNSPLFNGNSDIDPETIKTVELAFDYRPSNNLRLASNFYFYEIEDSISVTRSNTNTNTVENAEGQTGYGTEFEGDWNFYEQWSLKGNYAWQYSRNEETKERVRGVPEHQIYVAMAWDFLPQWKLQTQLNWIGHRINLAEDNNELKDYETVDVTLNSQRFVGYIDFSASVRNVFNSQGREPAVSSFQDNVPIPSRSFYLETTVHF